MTDKEEVEVIKKAILDYYHEGHAKHDLDTMKIFYMMSGSCSI